MVIGKYCSISQDVAFITDGIHPNDWVSNFLFRIRYKYENAYIARMSSTNGDIIIGSDDWINTGDMILSGVNIGDGAVVAAGSDVVSIVPSCAFVSGVLAKLIKYRFDEETILNLLNTK